MRDKKHFSSTFLSWLSLAIIVATGIVEFYGPRGVFLSWGYLLGILVTLISRRIRDIILCTTLSLMFIFFSFFSANSASEVQVVLLTHTYLLIGLGFAVYIALRVIRSETNSRNDKTFMAGIFSYGTQGIILTRLSGEVVLVNPYAEKMFDRMLDSLAGTSVRDIIQGISLPRTAVFDPSEMQAYFSDTDSRKQLTAVRADGSHFPVEITVNQYTSGSDDYSVIFVTDITERKQAEETILARTKELELVNLHLEAFSYSVSHDLRAPLRAVDGYAKMLEEDYGETLDEGAQKILSKIQHNAQRMGILIDDLLTFSRLGRRDLRKTTVNMTQLMHYALEEITLSMHHHADIVIQPLHEVNADASLMGHVLNNLMSNAIKYSSKNLHPRIEVSSTTKDDWAIFCVRDNGVGFDMKYAHKLFGVFQRLHTEGEFEGTGVGLATAHRILEKHGGSIWAEGEEGVGASFYFSLPLAPEKEENDTSEKIKMVEHDL